VTTSMMAWNTRSSYSRDKVILLLYTVQQHATATLVAYEWEHIVVRSFVRPRALLLYSFVCGWLVGSCCVNSDSTLVLWHVAW